MQTISNTTQQGVRTRLNYILIIGLTVLPLASLLFLAMVFAYFPIMNGIDEIVVETRRHMIPVYRLQLAVSRSAMPPNDYLITGDLTEKQLFDETTLQVDHAFDSLNSYFSDESYSSHSHDQDLDGLREKWASIKRDGADLFGKHPGVTDELTSAQMEQFDQKIDQLNIDLQQLVHDAEDHIRQDIERLKQLENIGIFLISSGFILALALGLGGGFMLTKERRHLKETSIRDPLTGISNRLGFEQYLHEIMLQSGSDGGVRYSVVLFDGDSFKSINDTYGHPIGDQVLRNLTAIVRQQLRETDFFARLGGDEFVLLFRDMTNEAVRMLCERIREAVESSVVAVAEGHEVRMTIAMGYASYPEDANDVGLLMQVVDQALYQAKRRGSNQVCGFDEGGVSEPVT